MSLVDWWLKEVDFGEDIKLLQTEGVLTNLTSSLDKNYEDMREKLFGLLPVQTGLENKHISFDSCATNIIDRIFSECVDDNTIVLTTGSEHPSVVKNLNKCKNVFKFVNSKGLESLTIDFSKYKKAFIYTIALSVGDNQYTSNHLIENLCKVLKTKGIPYITVLDAVQELFLLPRDYSMFDYVIGTAHALIPKFNTGIVISNNKPYANYWPDNGYTYYELLKILLSKRAVLEQFNFVMREYFSKYLLMDNKLVVSNNGQYTFNLMDYRKRTYDLNEIDPSAIPSEYSPATFRACPAAVFPGEFLHKLKNIENRISII